jgi:hypothetical protein
MSPVIDRAQNLIKINIFVGLLLRHNRLFGFLAWSIKGNVRLIAMKIPIEGKLS